MTPPLRYILLNTPTSHLDPLKEAETIDIQPASPMEINKVVRSGFIFYPFCMHNLLKQIAQSTNGEHLWEQIEKGAIKPLFT
jgi:hypothetical protein